MSFFCVLETSPAITNRIRRSIWVGVIPSCEQVYSHIFIYPERTPDRCARTSAHECPHHGFLARRAPPRGHGAPPGRPHPTRGRPEPPDAPRGPGLPGPGPERCARTTCARRSRGRPARCRRWRARSVHASDTGRCRRAATGDLRAPAAACSGPCAHTQAGHSRKWAGRSQRPRRPSRASDCESVGTRVWISREKRGRAKRAVCCG